MKARRSDTGSTVYGPPRATCASEPGRPTVPDMYDQQNLDRFDRILDAIDTWTAWNNGHPVDPDALARTITTLTDPRLRGRLPGSVGDIVQPLADWLDERGIDISTQHAGADRALGIGR